MVQVDKRQGSGELFPLFPKGEAELAHLEFGDLAFTGNGPNESEWMIGVERKRINDMVSSMATGRLSGHQLIGMTNSYHVVYLVVEGIVRGNPRTGVMEMRLDNGFWVPIKHGRRVYQIKDIWMYCNTLEMKSGVHVKWLHSPCETAKWVLAMQRWWTWKKWEDHHGHLMPHEETTACLTQHSLVRRMAAQLNNVGWERAAEIDKRIGSVEGMLGMSVKDWQKIPGIGKGIATTVWQELRGGGK